MKRSILTLLATITICLNATAQDWDNIEIKTTKVTDDLYMLVGEGGNIGVSIGEDGIFLIDDQYAPLTDKIMKAIRDLSDREIHFIFNTHYHPDHTGGNENLGKKGIDIIAHDTVYERLSDILNKDGLPIITFNDQLTFHLNGMDIKAKHYKNAHTDGDSIVYFGGKNVIHMGDLFTKGKYPYTDLDANGAYIGFIEAIDDTIKNIDDETIVIPGHGPLINKNDLIAQNKTLKDIYNILESLVKKKLALAEVIKLDPLQKYDEAWGDGFVNPERFLEITYKSIANTLNEKN